MLLKDRSLVGWHEGSWLRNVEREGFSACMECKGSEDYKFDKNNPELCKCETGPLGLNSGTKDVVKMDGINDCMKNLRVEEFENISVNNGNQGPVSVSTQNEDGEKDLVQPNVKDLCDGMKEMMAADADNGPRNMNVLNDGLRGLEIEDSVNESSRVGTKDLLVTEFLLMENFHFLALPLAAVNGDNANEILICLRIYSFLKFITTIKMYSDSHIKWNFSQAFLHEAQLKSS